jgi:hypothetical protein
MKLTAPFGEDSQDGWAFDADAAIFHFNLGESRCIFWNLTAYEIMRIFFHLAFIFFFILSLLAKALSQFPKLLSIGIIQV